MFHSARIKLTAYYLLIIMVISIAFSFAMYRILTVELDRVEQRQRVRRIFIIDRDLIEDAKDRLKLILAGVNLVWNTRKKKLRRYWLDKNQPLF